MAEGEENVTWNWLVAIGIILIIIAIVALILFIIFLISDSIDNVWAWVSLGVAVAAFIFGLILAGIGWTERPERREKYGYRRKKRPTKGEVEEEKGDKGAALKAFGGFTYRQKGYGTMITDAEEKSSRLREKAILAAQQAEQARQDLINAKRNAANIAEQKAAVLRRELKDAEKESSVTKVEGYRNVVRQTEPKVKTVEAPATVYVTDIPPKVVIPERSVKPPKSFWRRALSGDLGPSIPEDVLGGGEIPKGYGGQRSDRSVQGLSAFEVPRGQISSTRRGSTRRASAT